jgi:ribose 5-phosphate isomerase
MELEKKLVNVPGIVDSGLFINMASKAYIGQKDGTVLVIKK